MKELVLLTFIYTTSIVTLDVCKATYFAIKLQWYKYLALVVVLYAIYLTVAIATLLRFYP
jgi:hypothetical protein